MRAATLPHDHGHHHGPDGHDHHHDHDHDHDHPHDHDHDHGPDGHGHHHGSTPQGRRRTPLVVAGVLVACAVAAVPALLVLQGGDDDAASPPPATIPAPAAAAEPVELAAPEAVPALPAPTPQAAVEQFIQAEIERDLAASLAVLSDADRARIGSVDAWAVLHDRMPRIAGYELGATTAGGIAVELTLEPRLDEITGYTPARASATFRTVETGGGHLVDLAAIELTPALPDEAGAPAAAIEWAEARQACTTGAQYAGNLLGQPDVAEALCGAAGPVTASSAQALETFIDPTTIQAAFGTDAADFTRVVPLDGPFPFSVVTAPLGDRWVVVAVAAD